MIKKFDQFNEELKPSVYKKAADKLRMFGGVHAKRADALSDWSKSEEDRIQIEEKMKIIERTKHIGEFNMNFDIIESTSQRTDRDRKIQVTKSFEIAPHGRIMQNSKVLISAPNKAYITNMNFLDPRDNYSEGEISDVAFIEFDFIGVPSDDRFFETQSFFRILVPIVWSGEGSNIEFTISDDPCIIDTGYNDYDTVYKFADRQSAIKFKRYFLSKDNINNMISKDVMRMRYFFMEYSTGEEMDKMLTKIQSINTNRIYS